MNIRFFFVFLILGVMPSFSIDEYLSAEERLNNLTAQAVAKIKNSGMAVNPLPTFQALCNTFKDQPCLQHHPEPWSVSLPCFGVLAQAFYNYAKPLKMFTEYWIWKRFQDDITDKIANNQTTFMWFSVYIDALSILMTHPDEREDHNINNTNFDIYRTDLISLGFHTPACLTPDYWRLITEQYGNHFTKNMASVQAHARLFPYVVLFPYPFDLTDDDIVKTFPKPAMHGFSSNHSWFKGFMKQRIVADGFSNSIHNFFAHDALHFTIFLSFLSSIEKHGYDAHMSFDEIACQLGQRRNLFFRWLHGYQTYIEKLKANGADATAIRVATFGAFLVFHESRSTLISRLESLIYPPFFMRIFRVNGHDKQMINPDYYLPLLPKCWQTMAPDDLTAAMNADFSLLHTNVHTHLQTVDAQLITDTQTFLKTAYNLADGVLFDPSAFHSKKDIEVEVPSTNPLTTIVLRVVPKIGQYARYPLPYYVRHTITGASPLALNLIENSRLTPTASFLTEIISTSGEEELFCKVHSFFSPNEMITWRDGWGNSLLHFAAAANQTKFYGTLLTLGLDPTAENKFGESAPYIAAVYERIDILHQTRNHYPVDSRGTLFSGSMHRPINAGEENVIRLMYQELGGIDLNWVDPDRSAPLWRGSVLECYSPTTERVFKTLLEIGFDLFKPNSDNRTPLEQLILENCHKTCDWLIENRHLMNPVGFAAQAERVIRGESGLEKTITIEDMWKVFSFFVKAGADINVERSRSFTFFHFILMNDQSDILRYILEHKEMYEIDLTRVNFIGKTPYQMAGDACKELLKAHYSPEELEPFTFVEGLAA